MKQFDYNRKDIIINWRKPITIDEAKEMSEGLCTETYFYKLVAVHGTKYKLYYIGKCVQQHFTKRIFQRDHLNKRVSFKEEYRKHRIMVSLGDVIDFKNSKEEAKDMDQVERLLIYSHSHYPHLSNKKCIFNHNVVQNYNITNRGWREDNMYKKLGYGLFFEE